MVSSANPDLTKKTIILYWRNLCEVYTVRLDFSLFIQGTNIILQSLFQRAALFGDLE